MEGAWVPEWLSGAEFPRPCLPSQLKWEMNFHYFKSLNLEIACYLSYPTLKAGETISPNLGSWNLLVRRPCFDNSWHTCPWGFPRATPLPTINITQLPGQRRQRGTSLLLNWFLVWIFTVKHMRKWTRWFCHFGKKEKKIFGKNKAEPLRPLTEKKNSLLG